MGIARTEAIVFDELNRLKRALIELERLPIRDELVQVSERFAEELAELTIEHRRRREEREKKRVCLSSQGDKKNAAAALAALDRESQQDGAARKRLKQTHDAVLRPLVAKVEKADDRMRVLKCRYQEVAAWWQAQMWTAYLSELEDANFSAELSLPIVYHDDYLVVVDKPAGLLSVPGRRYFLQDSVVSRLRYQLPDCSFLRAVHRLDQATSGLVAIATCEKTHRALSRQFAERKVSKRYEAILSRPIGLAGGSTGTIDLPIGRQGETGLRRVVDVDSGKPSQTAFKVLASGSKPRVEFAPYTGRTHQIRVHASDSRGLDAPIVGDELYGSAGLDGRLLLHATRLEFVHPKTEKVLRLSSVAPF